MCFLCLHTNQGRGTVHDFLKRGDGGLKLTVKWLCPDCKRSFKRTKEDLLERYKETVSARTVYDDSKKGTGKAGGENEAGMTYTAMDELD